MRAKELIEDPVLEDELPAAVLILAAQLVEKYLTKNGDRAGDRLLSLKDAADKLRVSSGWLYHQSRNLPFVVRTGRKLSFSERGIEEYIRQKSAE